MATNPWGTWNVGNYKGNLDPSLMALTGQPDTLQGMMQSPGTAYSPDKRYMIGSEQNPFSGSKTYSIYDTTQGAGEPIYQYDANGKFQRTRAGAKIIGQLQGALMVAGAAAGFGALGASTGAGAGAGAASTGATEGAATFGGGLGTGTSTGGVSYGLGGSTYGGSAIGSGTTFGATAAGSGGTLESLVQAYQQNPAFRQAVNTGVKGIMGGAGGGSSNGGGMDLGSMFNAAAPLIGGLNDAYQQGRASDKMISWLGDQQKRIDNIYAPNSPEYNALWDQMSRMDAAAGRNSQYGPRSVDLAGKIAQYKTDANARLSAAFARPYSEALNQNAGRFAGLGSALGNQGTMGGLAQLFRMLTGNGDSGGGVPANPYFNGDSYGGGFDPGAYDAGYVDPGTVEYTGDFAFPDSGAGDWGSIDVSDWWA